MNEMALKEQFRMMAGKMPLCGHFRAFGKGDSIERVTLRERQRIREEMIEQLEKFTLLSEGERDRLLVPGSPLALSRGVISISHCPLGWAMAFSPHRRNNGLSRGNLLSLGLDLEVIRRVSPAITGKIAIEEELDDAPALALLWVAKEAAFKCLYRESKGNYLSHVAIANWSPKAMGYSFKFSARGNRIHRGQGFAFLVEPLALGCATIIGPLLGGSHLFCND